MHNRASKYGGGIYNEDVTDVAQCLFGADNLVEHSDLPSCFIEMKSLTLYKPDRILTSSEITSYNDSAGINGDFLFGGLSDRCQLILHSTINNAQDSILPIWFFQEKLISLQAGENKTNTLTSLPYQLCLCSNHTQTETCEKEIKIAIIRAQRLNNISLRAFDQFKRSVSTIPNYC